MKSHRRLSLLAVGAIASAAAVAAAFALTSGASATGTPFTALPAVGNVHALNAPAVFAPPAQVESLPADMRPAAGTVHALGSSGYGWVLNGALCIQMNNIGPGGCLTQFTKPVTLYLWGDSTGFNAGGVVPDEVVGLTLITSNGDVPVTLASNAFSVALPANTSITGERVTLATGQTFTNDDPVSLPHV